MADTPESKEIPVTKSEKAVVPATFNPFQDMERLFEDLAGHRWLAPFRWDRLPLQDLSASWMPTLDMKGVPKVDVMDGDENITVHAEMPGMDKENVKITLSGDQITIRGETQRENKTEKGEMRRSEIYRGAYQRSFTLPCAVDEGKATATMKDGILEIVMPKLAATKRHTVKIN